jgi:hypothetical protein
MGPLSILTSIWLGKCVRTSVRQWRVAAQKVKQADVAYSAPNALYIAVRRAFWATLCQ